MLKVGAGNCLVSLANDVLPSFLPFGTSQFGPPDCKIIRLTYNQKVQELFLELRGHLVQWNSPSFASLLAQQNPLLLEPRYQHMRPHQDRKPPLVSLHCQ